MPVHFAELPGAFSAALMFRTGRSDEPLGSCGISHLIEHLALFALGNPVHAYNGFVDLTRTVFYASGTRDEVAALLRDVCAALAGLPLDRLQDERRVLKTELAAVDPGCSRTASARPAPASSTTTTSGSTGSTPTPCPRGPPSATPAPTR